MTGSDLIKAYKGDPARIAIDEAKIAEATAVKTADTETFQADTNSLETLLAKGPLAEPGDDGQSVDVYSLDVSAVITVLNIPFASSVGVDALS